MTPEQGPLTARTRHEILTAVDAHLRQHKISRAHLAKALGLNDAEVSELFQRKIKNGRRESELCQLVNNWMEDDARARYTERPSDFVLTSVAEKLFGIVTHLRRRQDIAVATGPAGIGKSVTIKALLAEVPGTFSVAVTSDTRGAKGLRTAIYGVLATRRTKRINVTVADIVDRLKQGENVKTPRVLIIDQAHELTDGALRLLMDLHDHCLLSILLLGTIDLHKRISSDEDALFGQMASRVGLRVPLAPQISGGHDPGGQTQLFGVPEIRKLLRSKTLRLHPAAAKLLRDIANYEIGHLRRASRIFDWAEMIAAKGASGDIERRHVVAAATYVDGRPYEPPTPPDPEDNEEREAASA